MSRLSHAYPDDGGAAHLGALEDAADLRQKERGWVGNLSVPPPFSSNTEVCPLHAGTARRCFRTMIGVWVHPADPS